jgi:general secretion pathway protein G
MQATLERLRQRRENTVDEGGFTLVELLIVIVILSIMAAIVVVGVANLTSTSAQASCKSDYKTVEVAAEAYRSQVGVYPGDNVPTTAATSTAPLTTAKSAGVNALLGTVTLIDGTTVGPWLKDNPFNASHYQIEAGFPGVGGSLAAVPASTNGGNVQISVFDTSTPTAKQLPVSPATPTNTISDCTAVK